MKEEKVFVYMSFIQCHLIHHIWEKNFHFLYISGWYHTYGIMLKTGFALFSVFHLNCLFAY